MNLAQFDVLVIGAGAAGMSAAIGLARAGFAVAVVEGGPYPGAENWSGCVYFTESLADPEILGPDGVETLAWERRLVERGFFASDGHGLLGATYRDLAAFRHCFTVLRPIFDHHLAQIALRQGVTLFNATTAESLIRDEGRVIGVATNRGPLYADLVFLAEGDAAHLVAREGYESAADARDAPEYLHGIKQVIELPPGAIEERFGVGAEDGVAYEMLLRNGTLNGRALHLNMGGFVYTNRRSLSVGLVLPAANLARHFAGDPNLLTEWFLDLPALRPWLRDGTRSVFGAKLIRGGGIKDVPTLIDDGLAIGGAASAIGVDFPYPNYTGPATAMGLLLVRAVKAIRRRGEDFTCSALERHYLEPLRRTHYWNDVEYLRRWPEYIKRTKVFFGRNLDLALGTAHVWTRPRRWFVGKLRQWLLLLNGMTPWDWARARADGRRLGAALRLRQSIGPPALWRMLMDGSLNALRDLTGRQRAHVPPAGYLRLHYRAGDDTRIEAPRRLHRWFHRFRPILAAAARSVYRNDDTPLSVKLSDAFDLLLRQINVLDVLTVAGLGLTAAVAHGIGAAWRAMRRRLGGKPKPALGDTADYAAAARQAGDLTPVVDRAARAWDRRLANLALERGKSSHLRVLWPLSLVERDNVIDAGLWHVCPTHVFEASVRPYGQVRIIVNYDNCIKCETCWRTSDLVDWGRDGSHRFAYPVSSPAAARILDAADAAGLMRPTAPRRTDVWQPCSDVKDVPEEARRLLDSLEASLANFDAALAEEPRIVGRDRAEYLETLARHAQQLARRLAEVLAAAAGTGPDWDVVRRLAKALAAKAEERARRTWDRRFAWAAAGGRQIRQHHLAGLRRLLGMRAVVEEESADPEKENVAQLDSIAIALGMADGLCCRVIDYALNRVQFPGLFQDEVSRDGIGKFGAVKRLVATAAARRFVIETLASERGRTTPAVVALRKAIVAGCITAIADDTGQVFSGTADSEDDVFARLDGGAAAWQKHGLTLLRDWRPDGATLTEPGDGGRADELIQRQSLAAEHDEVERLRARLVLLVNEWQAAEKPVDFEVMEALARQDAQLYAARALLLRIHALLERGQDVAAEIPLLRVWLEETAIGLDHFAELVRAALEPTDRLNDRPLVDPGAAPAIATYAEFLAAPASYDSGDFLFMPVDLSAPRAVPEMAEATAGQSEMAIAALGHIRRTLEEARASGGNGDGVEWRLRRMEEDEFLFASLAFDVAGRAVHPGTRSARFDSAAAKVLATELVQRVVKRAEEAHLTEKRKRSARVLTIFEGTSDVQRFVMLRDLVDEIAPRWAAAPPKPQRHLAREALELEALKATFRQHFDAARALFGQALWQNPNLQANVFALADAAAWLKAAESVLGRMAWLWRRGGEETAMRHPVAARALAGAFAEVRDRLRRFDGELARLRRGHYAPHVRAASVLFDRRGFSR